MLELPPSTVGGLFPIFISLLDDLIPILDASKVFRDFSNGQSSRYLVRAVCLVTCKAHQATPFLRLRDGGPLLGHGEFASKLLEGLDAAVKAGLESDRVTKVQILALMHLHNDGYAGVDRSSMYLSQAISEAWSMSLHLKMPENPDQELCDRLWWTLRNFDRLNKPTMAAAPFIIDDTDVCVDRVTPRAESYCSQVSHVALIMGDLMGTATKVYKAGLTSTVDDPEEFPSLAELTAGTTFNQFHRAHRAYFEIWYHVAAMLSCRHSGPGTIHYKRRLDSAYLILDMMTNGGHESLPPLPLVPYALAFATTSIYRALHDKERPIEAAFRDLRSCCDVLNDLSLRWTSIRGVARLANRLLRFENTDRQQKPLTRASRQRSSVSACGNGTTVLPGGFSRLNEQAVSQPPMMVAAGGMLPIEEAHPDQDADGIQGSFGDEEVVEPWPNLYTSQDQLNVAIDDWFDYGISDILREPGTWELLRAGNDLEGMADNVL